MLACSRSRLKTPAQPMAAGGVSVSDSGGGPLLRGRPPHATELTVGFYCVGIQLSEVGLRGWQSKERRLASDIAKAFEGHGLDVFPT